MKIDLRAKPVRQIEWLEENERVKLKVIKFKGKFGQWLCRTLKKPNYFFINLDEVGSFIWKNCNGKNSIEDILEKLEKKYDKEKIRERLLTFLIMLNKYGYIKFE
ncbi:MAG TPA: PqqD family protein [Thermoplasmata archaeon]|nr:PqqD family protein [Thermoplasmata archaeon]